MKKIFALLVVCCLLLTGCGWLDGEYYSVTPHAANPNQQTQESLVLTNYMEMREALVNMVSAGTTKQTFFLMDIEPSLVDQYMNTAIIHITKTNAIGAYAVADVQYEVGTTAGLDAIAIEVAYAHGRQEILRIKRVQTMNSLKKLVMSAVTSYSANVVIQVAQFESTDLVQFVQDYVDANPDLCMEMPQVAVAIYPESGQERVIEISFTYQNSRDALRVMQETVAPIFSAAKMYVQGSEDAHQKYEQLYGFLMERFDYQYETSINPTYSLLRYGVGDSKAFAYVYKVMCRNAGIHCEVVVGSRDGDAHYWNFIKIGDTFYHLDLLACKAAGEFRLRTSNEMAGYVWDYSVYP